MYKELVISIFLVILIFIGDYFTQNYTEKAIEKINISLDDIKKEIVEENININNVSQKTKNTEKIWENYNKKLSYFIEHDELEKVENNLVGCVSYIESNEYIEAKEKIDEMKFILKHIEEKNRFNLKNIF